MDKRYEIFNEMLFESYTKTAIDNAVRKERMRKKAQSAWQLSLSSLTDAVLYALAETDDEVEQDEPYQVFTVQDKSFPVFNRRLAQGIAYLLPKDREIILLYYFLGMTDKQIAQDMGMTLPTISRRRNAAKEMLRNFLEDTK